MENLKKELEATNWEMSKYRQTLELMRMALYLDKLLLEAEATVGLMDGLPLCGIKEAPANGN